MSYVKTLLEMLTYRRPDGSRSELRFIRRFIKPLGVREDSYGNFTKVIGDDPKVLWSAHIDTVHRESGRQHLELEWPYVKLHRRSQSNCLGADNGAGVWLLTELIKANKPGLYIFHRAEESGRLGSEWIAKNHPHMLGHIDMAIAFDRRGQNSIITHQMGERCCSESFSHSLANGLGMEHVSDSWGSYTDTYSYMRIIPECTNISVGYESEHSKSEKLHIPYLLRLLDAIKNLDESSLPILRDPLHEENFYSPQNYDHEEWDLYPDSIFSALTVYDLVRKYPNEIAEILYESGYTAEAIKAEIMLMYRNK